MPFVKKKNPSIVTLGVFVPCDPRIDDAALREAQMRKDAVAAYEVVYAALGSG